MKKFIDKLIPTVLIIIMLVSGFKIVIYFYQAHKQKEIFKSVEQKISENEKGTTKKTTLLWKQKNSTIQVSRLHQRTK